MNAAENVINGLFDSSDSGVVHSFQRVKKKTKEFKRILSFDSSDEEQAELPENGSGNCSSEDKSAETAETSNYAESNRRKRRSDEHDDHCPDTRGRTTEERRKSDREKQMAVLRKARSKRSKKAVRAKEGNNNSEEPNWNVEFTESNEEQSFSDDSWSATPTKRRKTSGRASEESNSESGTEEQQAHCSTSTDQEKERSKSRNQEAHSSKSKRQECRSEERIRMRRLDGRLQMFKNIEDGGIPDSSTRFVLDYDERTKKPLVTVDPNLVAKLKPHQKDGIKFMWDTCFESIEQLKLDPRGGGCILAHCMGLGKTLQVIALVHTLLTHKDTGVNSVLILCPENTILNWVSEFKNWLVDVDGEMIEIYNLTKLKGTRDRVECLEQWSSKGGVMIIGYAIYRKLLNDKKMKKKTRDRIVSTLLHPGCDVVICDEGHRIKNSGTVLIKTLTRIRTMRRILLTGTPLQNNLMECYTMVNFVKPFFLGSDKSFQNRYGHTITRGQFRDSDKADVSQMKTRARALCKILSGIIQRRDERTLTACLPIKREFVVMVNLSSIQAKLYSHYLDGHSRIAECNTNNKGMNLLNDFQKVRLIWAHPLALRFHKNKPEKKRGMGTDEESESDEVAADGFENIADVNEEENGPWWSELLSDEDMEDPKTGPKVILLLTMLEMCEKLGDKMLVFSPSLPSLDVIEHFLKKSDESGERWVKGVDYFRLDGSTSKENRAKNIEIFNDTENKRTRLFLISTEAGGVGINLQGANRAVIFDASWNPSSDIQSIFRLFRFGQTKPTYVYRFVAQGTMEEPIFTRQITKLSIARRVIDDEEQMDRPFTQEEVASLYRSERRAPMSSDLANMCRTVDDAIMAELVRNHSDHIVEFRDYDTFLENNPEEELTESERRRADKEFNRTRGEDCNQTKVDNIKEKIRSTLTQLNPSATSESDLNDMYSRLLQFHDAEKQKRLGTWLSGAAGSGANRNHATTSGSGGFINDLMFNMSIKKTGDEELVGQDDMLIVRQQALLHKLTPPTPPLSPYSIPPDHVTRTLTRPGSTAATLRAEFKSAFKNWTTWPTMNEVGTILVLHFAIAVRVDTLEQRLVPLGITVTAIMPGLDAAESLLAGGARLPSDDEDHDDGDDESDVETDSADE